MNIPTSSPSSSSMDLPTPIKRMETSKSFRTGFLAKHKKTLIVVAVILALFYWFEIRPTRINKVCTAQAGANARLLLRNKAEVTTDASKRKSYQQFIEKDMYLRTDYESYYKKCLRNYGIFI